MMYKNGIVGRYAGFRRGAAVYSWYIGFSQDLRNDE